MTVRDALNSALDEEMSADPKVFLMGEEVRKIGMCHLALFLLVSPFHLFLLLFSDFCLQVGEYQGAYKVSDMLYESI